MFIDLNAPDNSMCEDERRMVKLWQNVIITAAKDACMSAQDAYDAYNWTKHPWSREVCDMARLDHGMIRQCFFRLQSDPDYRNELRSAIFSFKSKNNSASLTRRTSLIQQELFV